MIGLIKAIRSARLVRRGLSTGEAVLIGATVTTVSAAAWLASPYVLSASNDRTEETSSAADWPENLRLAVQAVDLLCRTSRATLLVESDERGNAPEFVVLWLKDLNGSNTVNRSEIVVLRHSRMLRSVTAYAWEPDNLHPTNPVVSARELRPGFAGRFLSDAGTSGRVIGVEIDQLRIVEEGSSDHSSQSLPGRSPGRIQLTCFRHSADSQIAASIPTGLPSWIEAM